MSRRDEKELVGVSSAMDVVLASTGDTQVDYSNLDVEALVAILTMSVVDRPEELKLSVTRSLRTIVIEIDVASDDVGKLIGRNGVTIDAIRKIARAAAGRQNMGCMISLLDDNRGGGSRRNDDRAYRDGRY